MSFLVQSKNRTTRPLFTRFKGDGNPWPTTNGALAIRIVLLVTFITSFAWAQAPPDQDDSGFSAEQQAILKQVGELHGYAQVKVYRDARVIGYHLG